MPWIVKKISALKSVHRAKKSATSLRYAHCCNYYLPVDVKVLTSLKQINTAVMKKIAYIIALSSLVTFGLSSCEKDRF